MFARLCGENTAFLKNLMLQCILSLDHKISENLIISSQQEEAAIGLFYAKRSVACTSYKFIWLKNVFKAFMFSNISQHTRNICFTEFLNI